jgi:hypothetical protein
MSPIFGNATVSLKDVDQDRANVIRRVLSAVLRSDKVRSVFAQIIDGIPIRETYHWAMTLNRDIERRTEPSEKSMALSLEFCASDDRFEELKLNATVRL